MGSDKGNFVTKCWRAAESLGGMVGRNKRSVSVDQDMMTLFDGKASQITSETDRVQVQEGKL